MGLSNDLISQFIKVTNDNTNNKKDKPTTYGTVIESGGVLFVQLDGSDLLTPVDTTTEINQNDRVTVNIDNHNATVTGNLTNPAVSKLTTDGLESKIERTAGSLTSTINDTKSGLESKIEQTASSLTTSINNTKSGLESKITQTSSSLTTQINNVNSNLSSKITQTASELTIKFDSGYKQGITTVNNQGIWVSQVDYGGHTHMSNTGFYVNNGKENVISMTASSGLQIKGNITTVGGSININDNFIVSTAGALTTKSTIAADGGIYTKQDIRGLDTTAKSGGLTLVTGTGNLAVRTESTQYSVYIQPASGAAYVTYPASTERCDIYARNFFADNVVEFLGDVGVVRISKNGHFYVQCGGGTGSGDSSSEIRCTKYAKPTEYVNIRAYNVCATNAVFANGVNVSSDRDRKRDIELYEVDAVGEICSTPVYTYHLDTDLDEELKRIGIIMQEAPLDAIDLSGKGVDLYQMATMMWRAIQQQQEMIDELKRGR